jgi:putative tricarboxylic transport membrane protein
VTRLRDIAFALGAMLLGAAWYHQASIIEDSLLSDAVGAGGVPKVLAAVMAGTGALLLLRTLLARPPQDGPGRGATPHLKAAGLLALMIGYVLLAPLLGYPLAIALFAAAAATYAGARLGPVTAAFGAGVALVLWLGFVKLLGVTFPAGAVFGG